MTKKVMHAISWLSLYTILADPICSSLCSVNNQPGSSGELAICSCSYDACMQQLCLSHACAL